MTALPTSLPSGHEPSSSEFQAILDLLNLGGLCYVKQAVVQSVTSNVWTVITMDSEVVDLENGHSTSVNTSRYTCPTAGWYQASGVVAWAANATGGRAACVAVNGTRIQGGEGLCQANATAATATCSVTPVVFVQLAVGDYVEIMGNQVSGGALNTINQADASSSMSIRRVVSL